MSTPTVTPKITTPSTWHLHGYYLVIIALLGVMAYVGITQHDARVIAEQTVKADQAHEKDLTAQLTQLQASTAAQVRVVQQAIAAVKTPAQAIAAIPTLSNVPLNARALPADPTAVVVDAVPLAQELASCKQDEIQLGSCQKELTIKDGIHADDQSEIKALKKKPSFWKRVKKTVEFAGVCIGIGAVLAGGHL